MRNHTLTCRAVRAGVIAIALLVASCAGTPRKAADAPAGVSGAGATNPARPATRIKDSAPEKAAALRAADPHLQLEGDEQRWGIEAARERRRASEERAADGRQKEKTSKAIVPLGPGSGRVEAPPTPTTPGSP